MPRSSPSDARFTSGWLSRNPGTVGDGDGPNSLLTPSRKYDCDLAGPRLDERNELFDHHVAEAAQLRERLASKKGFIWVKRQITPKEQAEIYGDLAKAYDKLKSEYDGGGRLLGLYDKCVRGR